MTRPPRIREHTSRYRRDARRWSKLAQVAAQLAGDPLNAGDTHAYALQLMGTILAIEEEADHVGTVLAAAIDHLDTLDDATLGEATRKLLAEVRRRVRAGSDDLREILAGIETLPPLTTTPTGDTP